MVHSPPSPKGWSSQPFSCMQCPLVWSSSTFSRFIVYRQATSSQSHRRCEYWGPLSGICSLPRSFLVKDVTTRGVLDFQVQYTNHWLRHFSFKLSPWTASATIIAIQIRFKLSPEQLFIWLMADSNVFKCLHPVLLLLKPFYLLWLYL